MEVDGGNSTHCDSLQVLDARLEALDQDLSGPRRRQQRKLEVVDDLRSGLKMLIVRTPLLIHLRYVVEYLLAHVATWADAVVLLTLVAGRLLRPGKRVPLAVESVPFAGRAYLLQIDEYMSERPAGYSPSRPRATNARAPAGDCP